MTAEAYREAVEGNRHTRAVLTILRAQLARDATTERLAAEDDAAARRLTHLLERARKVA